MGHINSQHITKIYMEDKIVKSLTSSEGQELPVLMGFTPNSPKIHCLKFRATKFMLDFQNHVVH